MFFALHYFILLALSPTFLLAHNASMPLTVPYGTLVSPTIQLNRVLLPRGIEEQPSANFAIDDARHILQTHPTCVETFNPPTDESSSLTLADFNVSPDDATSSVVFVNIWATWCAPCRAELPILLQLENATTATIAIRNLGDSPDLIARFAEEIGTEAAHIGTQAQEDILQTVNAQGLPYNAVFYEGQLIGVRNQAIHDDASLNECLNALSTRN